MAQMDMDSVQYQNLYIRVKDPSDHALIDMIANDLKDATGKTPTLTYVQQA